MRHAWDSWPQLPRGGEDLFEVSSESEKRGRAKAERRDADAMLPVPTPVPQPAMQVPRPAGPVASQTVPSQPVAGSAIPHQPQLMAAQVVSVVPITNPAAGVPSGAPPSGTLPSQLAPAPLQMLSQTLSAQQQQALMQPQNTLTQQAPHPSIRPMTTQLLAPPPMAVPPGGVPMSSVAPPQPAAAPPRPAAVAAAPALKMLHVACPLHLKAGDPLTVQVDGRKFALTVPQGVQPGQTFRVQLATSAAPRPPQPQQQQPRPQQPRPFGAPAGMSMPSQSALHASQAAMLQQAIMAGQPYAQAPRAAFSAPKQLAPPRPQFSLQPADKVSVSLIAPHAAREGTALTIDKRCFSLVCKAYDAAGEVTAAPLSLMASLMYEDGSPIMPPEARTTAMVGKQALACKHGQCTFKLRMDLISSTHGGHRFRVRIAPQDAALAAQRPALAFESEPFLVVTKNTEKKPTVSGGKTAANALGGPAAAITKRGRPPSKGQLGAALPGVSVPEPPAPTSKVAQAASQLTRHRYFPADAIRAVTDTLPPEDAAASTANAQGAANSSGNATAAVGGGTTATTGTGGGAGPELSRHGIAACDRLAAMVVQQLTQRAWHHARRSRTGARRLTPADVAVAASTGLFDFLGSSGVVGEWADAEAPATSPRAGAPTPALTLAPAPVPAASTTEAPAPPPPAPHTMAEPPPAVAPGSSSAPPPSASKSLAQEAAAPPPVAEAPVPMDVAPPEVVVKTPMGMGADTMPMYQQAQA